MATEKVLTLPLSGEEIRKAILDRISQRLEKDGYLNPNLAYDYFSAEIEIHVLCHDVGREAEVAIKETVTLGEPVESVESVDEVEGEFEIPAQPPNVERVETGQGIPVLAKNSAGNPEVKHIRYGRNKAKARV